MTIIVCELEINNFTTCDQWNMESFKKGYSFFHLRFCPLVGKMNGSKEFFCFSRGCEREKLFLLHLFYFRNNKQKCFMDVKLFKIECNCLRNVYLFFLISFLHKRIFPIVMVILQKKKFISKPVFAILF